MRMYDSLVNLVSGLGTAKDKSTFTQYAHGVLNEQQLVAAYRGDWIARKVVKIPAQDATREWRSWQTDQKAIGLIESEERRHGLRQKTYKAMLRARLFGGAALVLGIRGENPEDPLEIERVKQGDLEYVHVISSRDASSGELSRDVTDLKFGEPKFYTMSGVGGLSVKVHPSRLIKFVGEEIPDERLVSGSVWGDSVLLSLDDSIKQVGLCTGGIATLIHEAKIDVIRMPGLMEGVSTAEYRDRVIERLELANVAKSTTNALLLDKEEEWDRIEAHFAGLPDVLKLYLLIACGAADIPATRFVGQSAVGLNATGEGDLRNYYDSVKSGQTTSLTPAFETADEVLLRSALGTRNEGIFYEWNSLWQMSDEQRAELASKKAATFKVDVDSAVFTPEELREMRVNQLTEDGTYPGVEEIVEGEKDLDENDPVVKEQFEQGTATALEPAKQALNGAQISSLLSVVERVKVGELEKPSAKVILEVSFPSLSATNINGIVDPIGVKNTPKEVQPPPPGSRLPIPPGGEEGRIQEVEAAADAKPRTLYVRRDVVNAKEIAKHFAKQGFANVVADMHVTLCYSKTPVDWMLMGEAHEDRLELPAGGPRVVEPLGDEGAVVLLFNSSSLRWRHCDMVRCGASHDYDEFTPHVTISYDPGPDVLAKVSKGDIEPWQGKIVLGPEIFEEIDRET